jgi:hypothetical protein
MPGESSASLAPGRLDELWFHHRDVLLRLFAGGDSDEPGAVVESKLARLRPRSGGA